MLAFVTDLEGSWEKLASFVEASPAVSFDARGRLVVEPGCTFVFGGDAIDRGPHARRIVRALLGAKRRQPEQVVLIAGNRDINKLRLVRELAGHPPARTPSEVRLGARGALLRWIFGFTMGARDAFDHRQRELAAGGEPADDEAVVASFEADLSPGGDLLAYLEACTLAWLHEGTLVVHGAVTRENLGVVPGEADRASTVREWVEGLGHFYARELASFRASLEAPRGEAGRAAHALIAYQAPLPGSRSNPSSVVYGRPTDSTNNPLLPAREVVETLRREGVDRLFVGHTPSGDSPACVTTEGFALVLCDNSYGRVERGSAVHVRGAEATAVGNTVLDDGATARVAYELGRDPFLGKRDAVTGELVKARLEGGDYLLFRGLPDNVVTQRAATASELATRHLVEAWEPHR
jgi:hypothetical protein